MFERNVGGHVAFFAQGLADGRERGDASASQSRDRRSRRRKRPPERDRPASLSAVMTPAAIRSDPQSTPSKAISRARSQVHGLIAVSAVPAGIDNVCVWEVFAQDGAVAAQAVDQQRGCLAVPARRRYLLRPRPLHGECRKASALYVVVSRPSRTRRDRGGPRAGRTTRWVRPARAAPRSSSLPL